MVDPSFIHSYQIGFILIDKIHMLSCLFHHFHTLFLIWIRSSRSSKMPMDVWDAFDIRNLTLNQTLIFTKTIIYLIDYFWCFHSFWSSSRRVRPRSNFKSNGCTLGIKDQNVLTRSPFSYEFLHCTILKLFRHEKFK